MYGVLEDTKRKVRFLPIPVPLVYWLSTILLLGIGLILFR
jgi:hypothetical protein